MKSFSSAAFRWSVVAVVSAACALALSVSVPYRIHQGIYSWYLWVGRLLPLIGVIGVLAVVCALVFGIRSGRRLPVVLAGLSGVLLFFSLLGNGGIHSGPNAQAWCFNNLRKVEGAKFQLTSEDHMTNGTAASVAQISKHLGGFEEIECAEGGKYTIGLVGAEARCSVHGTISEMEQGWRREMQR